MQFRLGLPGAGAAGVWFLVAIAGLGGCSTMRAPSVSADAEQRWQARQPKLAELTHFTVEGRLGVQSASEGWHVSLRWRQDDGRFNLLLSAPLGQGSAQLEGDDREVTLTMADGRRWTAPDAESLVAQIVGTPLPVNGLRYWVRGLPMPDAAAVRALDEEGRLQSLEQAGWRIAYRGYQQVEGRELPTKLFMENAGYKVRLVVDTWTVS